MAGFLDQAGDTVRLLEATPGWTRVLALLPDLDSETVAAVIGEAARTAERLVAPLNPPADRTGCRIEQGRVVTPPGFTEAYRRFAADGWLGLDIPASFGGQDLPIALQAAVEPLFERACPAFMMAAGASRAAAHLIAETADPAIAQDWVLRLVAGEWAATICISEPGAGSDVGRIRTRARREGRVWRIDGDKCWISFGDHDMASRIGHCLLARTSDAPGTRGLSLFLVPDRRADGTANGVVLQRIEEKLGLHGSPTCVLGFDGSEATLLGEEGRGLPQLFTMIERMRLLTGCQGAGIAMGSLDVASRYAEERRQGGAPDLEPAPILDHADVRRQILAMEAETQILMAAVLELGAEMDLARIEADETARAENAAFAAWLMPMVKTFGAEAGFSVSSAAIQVLGGAGYTREFPVEQALRDARVLAVYEGTTGMQALDFLVRRLWREEGRGLSVFLKRAREEAGRAAITEAACALRTLDAFAALSREVADLAATPRTGEAIADSYMRAAWIAVSAMMALRLVLADAQTAAFAAIGRFRLHAIEEEMALMAARCRLTADEIDRRFSDGR
ncbi:acyl-CoA dehydrogenase family protein [Aurantimonas sp. VKM B-3413]|uniref:acyl-CoA dehydrogenase family protein n=1 Tax=Aurantimonas sp. VKM B-3413 TaxID=2779401 RepID=UPI001E4FC833|nr:acyl-CoA dehydrogenase family protein [Aurantimonas sp. VKM B-3413]MCB8840402.1 acyl-CoA dehydrogenase family protein [Aurantimonas sp. VKM B-3413]